MSSVVEYRIVGLPRQIDQKEFESHVERVLQGASIMVLEADYQVSNQKRTVCLLKVQTDLLYKTGARLLRTSRFEGIPLHVERAKTNDHVGEDSQEQVPPTRKKKKKTKKSNEWNLAKADLAVKFYDYVKEDPARLARACDREEVSVLFREFSSSSPQNEIVFRNSDHRRLEALVMLMLRQKKLIRSKRYGDKVVVTFAQDEPGDFAPESNARDKVLANMQEEQEDKHGVVVSEAKGLPDIVPAKGRIAFHLQVVSTEETTELEEVTVVGPQKRAFAVQNTPHMLSRRQHNVQVMFTSTGIGLYRGAIRMRFAKDDGLSFSITRHLKIKSGDKVIDDILKPTSPYEKKKKRFEKPPTEVVPPPKVEKKTSSVNPFAQLPHHKIPSEVQQLIMDRELEYALQKPDTDVTQYAKFWKDLLWASEYQAYEDIKLYDLENVNLKRKGGFVVLYVPGLAEGRPSVLRGDLVNVTWKRRLYKGRVHQTRLLEVLIELDRSFHKRFNQALDTVDVRFTFSRTTFRTSHEGCSKAVEFMGEHMLTPKPEHEIIPFERSVPKTLQWANRSLNDEQRATVFHILSGGRRPLPYIVFGPPGTGKTTTVVEAVYQLYRRDEYLNILLVAPSNDAADILVEKLASYFPPSEMRRVIAYSRSIDQVSQAVKPYVTEGLTDKEMCAEIMTSRIVVSTVNLAARFAYYGIPRGHFGVLCVDEAGHATEPEVIGVAASLMDFKRQDSQVGQLILAGDPQQLGPVVTSDLCQKFGLSVSYLERLTGTKVYSRDGGGAFPPDLLMKLVRTYRSHPAILKLPNELFYDHELLACGDVLSTHSLAKWEHLPQQGFPVIFHAVNGENLREGMSPSWFNTQEAQEVVNYVDLLVNQSRPAVHPEDIGIVTPYARQAQKIRQLLKHFNFSEIKVGSVETFQGQERRVIIISTVRAESDLLSVDRKFNLGFVCNKKRFNVAVTRAKSLLIVVGSPSVLATDEKTWLPFLKYCKENNGWAGQSWDENDVESGVELEGSDDTADWLLVDDSVSPAVSQEELGFINREE